MTVCSALGDGDLPRFLTALTVVASKMATMALDLGLEWILSAYSAIYRQSMKFLATMWSLMSMGMRIRKRAMNHVLVMSLSGRRVVRCLISSVGFLLPRLGELWSSNVSSHLDFVNPGLGLPLTSRRSPGPRGPRRP